MTCVLLGGRCSGSETERERTARRNRASGRTESWRIFWSPWWCTAIWWTTILSEVAISGTHVCSWVNELLVILVDRTEGDID
jgi:hypothetical protein